GAMLLEGMRRMDEAGQLSDSSNGGDLMRASLPDSIEANEGDDMASADMRGRVCPTCRKQYTHGEICPEDGSRLIVAASTAPRGLESMRPARPVPPPARLAMRPSRSRGAMIAVAGVGALMILGVLLLFRGSGSSTPPPSARPAAATTAPSEPPPTSAAAPT